MTRWERSMVLSVVASASLLIATACSSPTAEAPPTSPAGPTSVSTPASSPEAEVVTIDGTVIGTGVYPEYTLEAPSSWRVAGGFVIDGASVAVGVSVWDVGEVPRDPCLWKGSLSTPGPTVDDLVRALTAQRYRDAGEPTDVELGGASGRYLEWSVPKDWKVTGDADFEGCDGHPHTDFVSWLGDGLGERYQQVAGQVDMLWVLDVDGERLLIDATYAPDTSRAKRATLTQIVESIRFTDLAT